MHKGSGLTERDELDILLGVNKPKRRKTSDDEKSRMARNFIARMNEAADSDEASLADEKPAVEKLKLLPEIKRNLLKKDLQQELLDNNCLLACKRYLELLPTGDHPNLTIRTAVLEIISQLPVGVFHLEKSTRGGQDTTLGEEIYRVMKDKKEVRANRVLAKKLVQDWYRMLTGSSTSQKDLARADEERFREEPHERATKARAQNSDFPMHRLAIRVAQKAVFDYRVRPEVSSEVKDKAAEKVASRKGGRQDTLQSKMRIRAKANRKGEQRAETCSIEGRGMTRNF
eukprot:TRINITY_DN8013_c0_g1_i7.p1 TRINITY_DN8013_c0_g1~~TRINITY_DN8013_c0_g1_i7.p1  ORF type:complete len:286 (-),score=56.50 TRINITY_DN8013_c0_g1_i7:377-1234(-)